jgi:uncharacterized OB-fold protein
MEMRTAKKFYDSLAKGKIYGIRCRKCKKYTFPPLLTCRECSSDDVEWVQMSGKGKLFYYSHTILPAKKFANEKPSAYGLVEMEEGPVFFSRINNADISSPEAMQKGNAKLPLPVKARISKVAGMNIVTFDLKG